MKTAADPTSAMNIQKSLSLDCKLTGSLFILFLAFAVKIMIAVPKYSDIFLQSKIEIPLPANIMLPLFVTLAPIKCLTVTICMAISLTFIVGTAQKLQLARLQTGSDTLRTRRRKH